MVGTKVLPTAGPPHQVIGAGVQVCRLEPAGLAPVEMLTQHSCGQARAIRAGDVGERAGQEPRHAGWAEKQGLAQPLQAPHPHRHLPPQRSPRRPWSPCDWDRCSERGPGRDREPNSCFVVHQGDGHSVAGGVAFAASPCLAVSLSACVPALRPAPGRSIWQPSCPASPQGTCLLGPHSKAASPSGERTSRHTSCPRPLGRSTCSAARSAGPEAPSRNSRGSSMCSTACRRGITAGCWGALAGLCMP